VDQQNREEFHNRKTAHKEILVGKVRLSVAHRLFDEAAKDKKLVGPCYHTLDGKEYAVVLRIMYVEDYESWAENHGQLAELEAPDGGAEPQPDGDMGEDDGFGSDGCLFDCQ